MLGERYVVRKGDSLWRIAESRLGSGTQWPRIWKYNNRPEVVRETGRGIRNPDLIYIGQILILPHVPGTRPGAASSGTPPVPHTEAVSEHPTLNSARNKPAATATPTRTSGGGGTSLSERLKTEKSPIAFKYKLDDLRWPPRDVGTAIIEVRMTGDVLLMTKKQYPVTYVTSRGEIELQVTRQANHAFGQLIEDMRFIYDPSKKQVTLRSMLVSQSGANAVATAIGVEMNPFTLVPKLRAEIRLPKLEGSVEPFRYVALDVKIVIEITPKADPPRMDSPRQLQPVTQAPVAVPQGGRDWSRIIGVGLVVVAGAVVVGTIVEDFFTAGAGVADDPASFALAGASLTRGLAMMRGGAAAAAALPLAPVPANVQQKSRVTLDGRIQ